MEAVDNLNAANIQYEKAKEKSKEIESQGLALIEQNNRKIMNRAEDNVKRIEEAKFFTIRFEEEKAITEVVRHVLDSKLS